MEIHVGLFIKICVIYSELSNDIKNNTLFKGNMQFFLYKLSFLSTRASQETGFLTIKMKNLTLGLRKWLKKLEFRVSVQIKICLFFSELSNDTKNNTLFKGNMQFFLYKLSIFSTWASQQTSFLAKKWKKITLMLQKGL